MKILVPLLVFSPALGALLQAVNPRPAFSRTAAILSSSLSAVLAVFAAVFLATHAQGENLEFSLPWISSYSIYFSMEINGLNLLSVLSVSLVFPFLIVSEWERQYGRRGIHALLLILQTATLGAICSEDLFLFLFFYILSPIPIYFLGAIWGDEGKNFSAFRWIVVQLFSGALALFAVLLIYHLVEPHTFLLSELVGKWTDREFEVFGLNFSISRVAFLFITASLALRAPVWPFQGAARGFVLKAPSSIGVATFTACFPVTVVAIEKIALGLFPGLMAQTQEIWLGFGMANIIFGALTLIQEKDLRGVMVSLSTLFVGAALLGASTGNISGWVGSNFFVISAVLAIALWGFTIEILKRRTHSYETALYSGVMRTHPSLGSSALLSIACGLGVPGTVGFVSLSLLFLGCFQSRPAVVLGMILVFTIVLGKLFQVYRNVFLGKKNTAALSELDIRERILILPMSGMILVLGFFPSPFVEIVKRAMEKVLS